MDEVHRREGQQRQSADDEGGGRRPGLTDEEIEGDDVPQSGKAAEIIVARLQVAPGEIV
jgi:hypothetical protein